MSARTANPSIPAGTPSHPRSLGKHAVGGSPNGVLAPGGVRNGESAHLTETLRRLRGDPTTRPSVDRSFAGGLREQLEDALAEAALVLPLDAPPLRITKRVLEDVLGCEAMYLACKGLEPPATEELLRGRMVDALFQQWVGCGRFDSPYEDALIALDIDDSGDLPASRALIEALSSEDQERLAIEVRAHARSIEQHFGRVPRSWFPRTQEQITVPLCGGRIILSGRVDLALGPYPRKRRTTCLLEVKSGHVRPEDRAELGFYAVIETLRVGAPPFAVAAFYTSTAGLDVIPVTEEFLLTAVHRIIKGTKTVCELAGGREPDRTPNLGCGRCPELTRCEPGQQAIARRSVTGVCAPGGEAS
jgi:hypothetical protein